MNSIIVRNHPYHVLGGLDRMMDAVFGDFGGLNSRTANGLPAVDVSETEAGYVVQANVPGFAENNVEIKVDDQLLTISGTLESSKSDEKTEGETQDQEASKEEFLIRERRLESFSRSFTLPRDVEKEQIKAVVSNGVLRIDLPKTPKVLPRTINIKKA